MTRTTVRRKCCIGFYSLVSSQTFSTLYVLSFVLMNHDVLRSLGLAVGRSFLMVFLVPSWACGSFLLMVTTSPERRVRRSHFIPVWCKRSVIFQFTAGSIVKWLLLLIVDSFSFPPYGSAKRPVDKPPVSRSIAEPSIRCTEPLSYSSTLRRRRM